MVFIYIFLYLILTVEVYSTEEYVPTLIWTSRQFHGRKNVDYLASKKVRTDLFESYLMELLGNNKPLIVVFLEKELGTHDLEWRNDDGDNSFPFLSKLTEVSRVDYFRSVESPYRTLTHLSQKGFKLKHQEPGEKFGFDEGDLLVVEFHKVEHHRQETLKKHDEQMKEILQQLVDSGKNWIFIYTARGANNKDYFSDFKQISPWHVEEQFQVKSTRALSLYQDEYTGFALITKSSLRLLLPSLRTRVVKNLESYSAAAAKPSGDAMDFVIWFTNYTVTLKLTQLKGDWKIKEVRLLNGNGDSLKLVPRKENILAANKCYVQLTEFQNEGKPMVKVIVPNYKFIMLPVDQEPCQKPYRFELTFFLIFASVVSTVVSWNKLLENIDFSRRSKPARISVSTDNLLPLSSKVIP